MSRKTKWQCYRSCLRPTICQKNMDSSKKYRKSEKWNQNPTHLPEKSLLFGSSWNWLHYKWRDLVACFSVFSLFSFFFLFVWKASKSFGREIKNNTENISQILLTFCFSKWKMNFFLTPHYFHWKLFPTEHYAFHFSSKLEFVVFFSL